MEWHTCGFCESGNPNFLFCDAIKVERSTFKLPGIITIFYKKPESDVAELLKITSIIPQNI